MMMIRTKTLSLAVLAAMGASCAPAAPQGATGPIPELAGRTAGPPQSCVRMDSTGSLRIADRGAILYSSGSTIWANLPGCPGASDNDILIAEPTGSQHCRGDIIRTMDRLSRIPGPSCVLGDFVPYRR